MPKYGLKSSNNSISTLKSNVNQERTGIFMKQVIIEMVGKIKGGNDAAAAFLGLSVTQFNNRLYQSNGQRFKDEELIALQCEFELTDYADEVCRLTGGTFNKQLAVESLDGVELWELQQKAQLSRAKLQFALADALSDGIFSAEEQVLVRQLQAIAVRDDNTVIEANIAVHSK